MKKNSKNKKIDDTEMLPEYDFASMKGKKRGKYYKAYRAGHTVKIHKTDGTILTHYFTLEDGAVMLEPDVRPYFQDSDTLNNLLRTLIAVLPKKHDTIVKPKDSKS